MNVTSAYDAFLFAPMGGEAQGMPLSVLSALARLDVDPWEEAARLAALPAPDAERILASMLDLFPGRRQGASGSGILAARLVALLPRARPTTATAPMAPRNGGPQLSDWVVYLCLAIFIAAVLSPHYRAATTAEADSATTPKAPPHDADNRVDKSREGSATPPSPGPPER